MCPPPSVQARPFAGCSNDITAQLRHPAYPAAVGAVALPGATSIKAGCACNLTYPCGHGLQAPGPSIRHILGLCASFRRLLSLVCVVCVQGVVWGVLCDTCVFSEMRSVCATGFAPFRRNHLASVLFSSPPAFVIAIHPPVCAAQDEGRSPSRAVRSAHRYSHERATVPRLANNPGPRQSQ